MNFYLHINQNIHTYLGGHPAAPASHHRRERGAAPDPPRPPCEGSLMNPVPQWSPGRIPVAVSGGGLIALDGEPALVVRLWEAMEAGAPLADLLRGLAGAHGGDVFSLPNFQIGRAHV